jgi:hypothetical protein
MIFEFRYPVQPGVFEKRLAVEFKLLLKIEKFWLISSGSGLVKPSLKTKATKLKMKRAESRIELPKMANKKPFCWESI